MNVLPSTRTKRNRNAPAKNAGWRGAPERAKSSRAAHAILRRQLIMKWLKFSPGNSLGIVLQLCSATSCLQFALLRLCTASFFCNLLIKVDIVRGTSAKRSWDAKFHNIEIFIHQLLTHHKQFEWNVLSTRYTCMKCGFQSTVGAPEQFMLQRYDAATFCCVVSKCQTRTNDKLEKCVHSVAVLCSICRNLYRTNSIHGQH